MEGAINTSKQKRAEGGRQALLGDAGLSPKAAAAWAKGVRFNGSYRRDVAAAEKFWRDGAGLLAKLPKKPKRNPAQQAAATALLSRMRESREDFLSHHADAIYRKLTKNHAKFIRVEELCYDAAKLVPGLAPKRKQVEAEAELMQSEKDGVEVDQGIFLARVLADQSNGMHLCQAMLRPKGGWRDEAERFRKDGVIDYGPAKLERRGKTAIVTIQNPRFLNAEDDNTLGDTERAADIAISIRNRNLRVARRQGRASEVQGPQGLLCRHQPHPSLPRQDSVPLVHHARHGHREQDASAAWRIPGAQSGRNLWRHAREALGRAARRVRDRRRLPISARRWTTSSPAATPT